MPDSWGEKLTASVSVLTLGVGLLALFAGVENWWMIFVVGWAVVTPLVAILFDVDDEKEEAATRETPESAATTTTSDALETLRDRYARGELSEEQFERKVERLLETETVEDARDSLAGRTAAGREQERASGEREPEPER